MLAGIQYKDRLTLKVRMRMESERRHWLWHLHGVGIYYPLRLRSSGSLVITAILFAGLHLCTWGFIDPVTQNLDVSLGIPPSALAMIGLKCSKEQEMLVIPVSGKASSLKVSWTE